MPSYKFTFAIFLFVAAVAYRDENLDWRYGWRTRLPPAIFAGSLFALIAWLVMSGLAECIANLSSGCVR